LKISFLENINLSSVLRRFPIPIIVSTLIGILSLLILEEVIDAKSDSYRFVCKFMHVLLLLFASSSLLSVLKINNTFVQKNLLAFTLVLFVFVGFWAYNKTLFLRFLEASVYTLFIFVALSIAIVALDKLFGVSFKPLEIYGDLWIILLSIFQPLYFFSRFPKDLSFDNKELESSFAFRVFVRRILIPIVLLYGLILFAYILKIIGQWSWPRGWVSNMVLWFSVCGTLAYLLNYIQLDEKENVYVKAFKKYYFHFQALMSIVLLLAVYKRISEYGITEPRYIVASLGLWLFCISLYFVISSRDNIKWIPASLALMILLGTIGPLNMHNTTIRSQFKRLKQELVTAKILNNGVLTPAENLSKELGQALSNRLWVMDKRNALDKLKEFEHSNISLPIDSVEKKIFNSPLHFRSDFSRSNKSRVYSYATALGIPYSHKSRFNPMNDRFHLYTSTPIESSVVGFDQMVQLRLYKGSQINNVPNFSFSDDHSEIVYQEQENEKQTIPLNSLIEKYALGQMPGEQIDSISFDSSSADFDFRFLLQSVSGRLIDDKLQIEGMDGIVLIKKHEPNN